MSDSQRAVQVRLLTGAGWFEGGLQVPQKSGLLDYLNRSGGLVRMTDVALEGHDQQVPFLGVRLDSIQRIENRFVEFALQREIPILARHAARADALRLSELAFGEPSDSGLTTLLDEFYGSWSDLASSPGHVSR